MRTPRQFAILCSVLALTSFPVAGQGVGRLAPFGMHGAQLHDPENWIAVVGDSGTTGAASAPALEPTLAKLFEHFKTFFTEPHLRSSFPVKEPMTRVFYSRHEYQQGVDWWSGLKRNSAAKLALMLDAHENSFAYIAGRALGVEAQDIVLVGQDGVMVDAIPAQLGRIFEMKTSTLPPRMFISFTANDLCDEEVIEEPVEARAARFRARLEQAWEESAPFLRAHAKGTRISVLAPLDIANVIDNREIQTQKVNVEAQGEITCGRLRSGELKSSLTAWFVLRMLNLMCPSVTSTHPGDRARLDKLRAVQTAFIGVWQEQIARLNTRYASQGIRWEFLSALRDVHFGAGDVGNDCFHPSAQGHAKIADVILHSGD